jgi:hypothetical protein
MVKNQLSGHDGICHINLFGIKGFVVVVVVVVDSICHTKFQPPVY